MFALWRRARVREEGYAAIGWAFREYAKTDAGEVRRFVCAHDAELSGLSQGEALKNL